MDDKFNRSVYWVNRTFCTLVEELNKLHIPFTMNLRVERLVNDVEQMDDTAFSWYPQLKFPWAKREHQEDEPDVIVGFLHIRDDYVFETQNIEERFCSVETCNFPFDENDITVFATPRACAEKIGEYYRIVMGHLNRQSMGANPMDIHDSKIDPNKNYKEVYQKDEQG